MLSVLNPNDYKCGNTPLDGYVGKLIPSIDENLEEHINVLALMFVGAFDVQTYEALLYGDQRPAPLGDNNEYAKPITKAFGQAKAFWDIDASDMILGAMDSNLWQKIDGDSPEAKAALKRAGMGMGVRWGGNTAAPNTLEVGVILVTLINGIFEGKDPTFLVPSLKDGKNDILTMNAFAFSAKNDPSVANDPYVSKMSDRMIFGNGILHALEALGLGEEGPQSVLAHEYAHQVQFGNNVVFDATTPAGQPEATRRTELMADAMGSYFATHKRGLTLNAKRVAQVSATFYNVGDCSFDDSGHHGTPLQRERASLWGSKLASDAQKQGKVLPSATVIKEFEKALPTLVAPDAE